MQFIFIFASKIDKPCISHNFLTSVFFISVEVYDSNEPVVALCQGCTGNGGDFTTSKPETTTTGTNPGTTTTQTHGEDCCQKVTLESSGGIQQHYHEALGTSILPWDTS